MISTIYLVNAQSFGSRTISLRIAPIVAVLELTLGLIAGSLPDVAPGAIARVVASLLATAAFLSLLIILLAWLSRGPRRTWVETTMLTGCLLVGIIDTSTDIWPFLGRWIAPQHGLTIPYGPMVPIPLALAMVSGVVRYSRAAHATLSMANEALELTVREREADLKKVYQAREEELRQAALTDERQRLMRDVHDGFGGRLLALSLLADNRETNREDISRALRESLQELRLIIDSMDTAESDMALGALRGRLQPRIEDAGIALSWQVDVVDPPVYLPPSDVLSLYRVIQEAVSNAIRHSGCSAITFTATFPANEEEQRAIALHISDNGHRFGDNVVPGQGLKSIEKQVAQLGGVLSICNRDNGTALDVWVPLD